MTDVLVVPECGKPWVLGVRDGQVVRLSSRDHAKDAGRVYYTMRTYCGGQKDKPADLKRMVRVCERERKLNATAAAMGRAPLRGIGIWLSDPPSRPRGYARPDRP